jgi:hypothetical protein
MRTTVLLGAVVVAVLGVATVTGMQACVSVDCTEDRPCPPPPGWVCHFDDAGFNVCQPPDGGADGTATDVATDAPSETDGVDTGPGDSVVPSTNGDADAGDGFDGFDGFRCDPSKSPHDDPCVIDDPFGVFVSPNGVDSDAGSIGTMQTPAKTIAHGIDLAVGQSKRVYVCASAGAYTDKLSVGSARDGVSVYGGFDCTGALWKYSTTQKAIVAPSSGVALEVSGLATGVTFEDMEFDAANAPSSAPQTGPGASSIAVVVSGSQNVTFRRVVIQAGDAQPGAPGVNGVNTWSGPAPSGNGADGGAGGPTLPCPCGGSGGAGGEAGVLNGSTLQVIVPAQAGSDGQPRTKANGGVAANAPSGCGDGTQGSQGSDGNAGLGAVDTGSLSIDAGWLNVVTGGNGSQGAFAQGGGGGGAGFSVQGGSATNGGGGGGCGGCGGALGVGGFGGGSSLALLSIGSAIALDTCTITARKGGDGGKGGDGQMGQAGGDGGAPTGTACQGGPGGNGGTGGGGGGGAGGNSIAIAYKGGTAPNQLGTVITNVATTPASGGAPGAGITAPNGKGAQGLDVAVQMF